MPRRPVQTRLLEPAARKYPPGEVEALAKSRGFRMIIGVDEAGRGPLAGPVTIAAVAWAVEDRLEGLTDSKLLSESRREELFPLVRARCRAFAIAGRSPAEIDRMNILRATLDGMAEAVRRVMDQLGRQGLAAQAIYIDGRDRIPGEWPVPQWPIVKGDQRSFAIAGASVLAKVTRDRLMDELHGEYPQYGFRSHKGYPAPAHLEALRVHGPCPHHRMTYRGVRREETSGHG
ncbi:MAG: Ribonuclease HII [Myxococcota bacterium]|nr:Ribonuclease HII [Myxococcota bacterium]